MILVFIVVFCALIALGFGAAAAWSDAARLIIPNMYAACVGAAFIPAFLMVTVFAPESTFFAPWKSHLIAAIVMLGITYILFYFKLMGGGDSKFLTVYALWSGLGGLMPFLFITAVTGGLLGVITLILGKYKPVQTPAEGGWVARAQSGAQDVPYGVAIFVGALFTFWQVGYLQPETIQALATGE